MVKHRKCDVCGKEIVLSPSATERAQKYGGKPSDYLNLFRVCTDCLFEMRDNKPHPRQPGVAKQWLESKNKPVSRNPS